MEELIEQGRSLYLGGGKGYSQEVLLLGRGAYITGWSYSREVLVTEGVL